MSFQSHSHPDMPTPFLGRPIEICIVTSRLRETLSGLVKLGIGPFKVYSFNSETVTEMTHAGKPTNFEIQVAFAEQEGMVWEVMQPVSGPTIMQDFLESTNGKGGIQHVAFDMQCSGEKREVAEGELVGERAREEAARRRKEFERRGFPLLQSGLWHGKKGTCEFMYFDTAGSVTTCFETYVFSDDWEDPEETEIYPAPEQVGS